MSRCSHKRIDPLRETSGALKRYHASMNTPTEKRAALAARIRRRELVIAPGVYDLISTRIADRQSHAALYMTGYGTVASYLGLPDAGLASYTDMVLRASQMAGGSNTPIIADADTGLRRFA